MRRLLPLGLLLGLAACPRPAPPAPPADAGAPAASATEDGGADGGTPAPSADAGEDAGVPYQVRLWADQPDAGLLELALDGGAALALEPTARLALELRPGPADLRVRLLDTADQALDSDDAVLPLDGGVRYQLALLEPLRPGRTYTLSLDAEQGTALLDPRGRPLDDVRLLLQVRGEAASDAAPRPRRKRK